MTEEVRERWSALRIELQEVTEERDKLAAENARLREGLFELADGTAGVRRLLEEFWKTSNWWFAFYPTVERIVPAHIVALQEAIYREGGE